MALPHKEHIWGMTHPLHEVEAVVADYIICDACGTYWSPNREDYPELQAKDYIPCSCGNLLCQKRELQ